jgi:transposase
MRTSASTLVAAWLEARNEGWLSAIERVALNPYRGYYSAPSSAGPRAPEVVMEAFHLIRLGNEVVDEVRRRVQQDTLGHRGHKGDPLYGIAGCCSPAHNTCQRTDVRASRHAWPPAIPTTSCGTPTS